MILNLVTKTKHDAILQVFTDNFTNCAELGRENVQKKQDQSSLKSI